MADLDSSFRSASPAATSEVDSPPREVRVASVTEGGLSSGAQISSEIYSKKVYFPWYRRYQDLLGEGSFPSFQPYEEVQIRDEEIALMYYYGEIPEWATRTDANTLEERKRLLMRFQKKERDEMLDEQTPAEPVQTFSVVPAKRKALDAKAIFGPSKRDRKKLNPVIEFLAKMHIKRHREWKAVTLKPNSKWRVLLTEESRDLIKNMALMRKQQLARTRFKRGVNIVKCVTRFINFLVDMAKSTGVFFQEIQQFKEIQVTHTEDLLKKRKMIEISEIKSKLVFNNERYLKKSKINLTTELHLILTKRWTQRTARDIDMVVNVFQNLRSFVEYPETFQRRLAKVAWLIKVPPARTIIREGHLATDFYFLIHGSAKMSQLHGGPWVKQRGIFKLMKNLKEGDAFGEESVTNHMSLREYSVETTSPCNLLSINVNDYVAMLLEADEDEEASEHVLFLSSLEFMDGFPKQKLIEEGADHIVNYYYRPGSLITKSIVEAVYVFAVKSGSMEAFIEIKPPSSVAHMKPRDKSASMLKLEDGRRFTKLEKEEEPRDVFVDIGNVSLKDFKDKMSSVDAEQLLSKINPQRTQRMRKAIEQVSTNEMAKAQEESKLFFNKAMKLSKTLTRDRRKTLMEAEVFHDNKDLVGEGFSVDGQRDSKSKSVSKQTPDGLSSSTSSSSSSSSPSPSPGHMKEKGSSFHIIVQDMIPRERSNQNDLEQAPLHSILHRHTGSDKFFVSAKEQPSVEGKESHDESGVSGAQTAGKGQSEKKKHRKRLPFQESGNIKVEIIRSFERSDSSCDRASGTVPRQRRRSTTTIPHSQWKRERVLVKGDSVGHEWLDYNDRPFDPPKEDLSLVSNGCECIMIQKSFLLKYLRKEW